MDASTPLSLSDSDRRLSLAAVIISSFGVGISFGLGYPLTAIALEQKGEPSWIIGLAGAAPSVAILILLPLLPAAVARVKPYVTILTGCALSAAGYMSLYLLDDTYAWIAIRFLMGAAVAMPWIVGETWINFVSSDETRTRTIAVYATSFFAGFAVGPLLLDATGTSGPLPFLAGVLGALISAVPIYIARHLAPDLAHEPETGLIGGIRMAPAAMAGAFLGGFLEMSHFSLLPNVAIASGMDESNALRLLTSVLIGGLATQFILGWIGDRTSREALLIALGLGYIALVMLLPEFLRDSLFAMALVFLLGAVVIGFYTLGLAILGEAVAPRDLATANAAFIMMYTIGGIIGPVLSGFAMTYAPIPGFVLATALAAVVMSAISISQHRQRQT